MKQKVALVLGSGGARGIAHIGVIEELLERDYEIASIAGCSIGSVVGGMYAAGKLGAFKDWVINLDKMDVLKLVDFTFSLQGFVRGERIFDELEKLLDDCWIEDLEIPYVAVATDLIGQQQVVYKKGSLFDAMRASIAIPTVMTPVRRKNKEIVDGGVLNPLPMDLVKRQNGDIMVAVDLNANIPYEPINKKDAKEGQKKQEKAYKEYLDAASGFIDKWKDKLPFTKESTPKKLGVFDILNKSFDLSQDRLTELLVEKYKPDVQLKVSREAATTFEFYRSKELINLGREACKEALSKAEEKVEKQQEKQ